jgi:hypothetical protein
MAIPGIIGQGVSTQATSGFLQSTAGLRGRVINVFQNKYLAVATLCVTMFVLIRVMEKVSSRIVESKLVMNFSAKIFETRSDEYESCRFAISWMATSMIITVGMLGVSKILQLPISRETTLAMTGWILFSYVVYTNYILRENEDDRVEGVVASPLLSASFNDEEDRAEGVIALPHRFVVEGSPHLTFSFD